MNYTRNIQAYSEACVTLVYSEPWHVQNPDLFRNLASSETWDIQNHGIYSTLAYSKFW